MFSKKDYSTMPLNELVAEEKKVKAQRMTTAVLIGFVVGVAVWSATHKGGFYFTIGLLVFALMIGSRYSKKLKDIQEEIGRRDSIG